MKIWRDYSSSKYASTDGVGFFDMTSYFQDGGHDVISRCRLPTLLLAYAAYAGAIVSAAGIARQASAVRAGRM